MRVERRKHLQHAIRLELWELWRRVRFRMRKLLLDRSDTILQDHSGIPLTYFEPKRWRLQAFGHYAGPISIFANFYQPQMAALFQGSNPIVFGIGYRWRKNESNLLLRIRSHRQIAMQS
jgi:hypothetical protein